jgi:hypothetical protein
MPDNAWCFKHSNREYKLEPGLLNIQVRLAAQQGVTRIIAMTVMNSVTPEGADKHELLFYKLASEVRLGYFVYVTETCCNSFTL